jgi:hypothetical protein
MSLTREEKLVCIIALERIKKPSGWAKSALNKLLFEMNMKPRLSA